MDLSFQEKSAWGLILGLTLVSAWYFPLAFRIAENAPNGIPLIVITIGGTIALVVIEIVYHIFIAAGSSEHESDERDVLIDLKAERNSGIVLGLGLFWLIGFIVAQSVLGAYPVPNPLEIVVWIMLTITVAEIVKLFSQIWYYRVGV